MPEYERENIVYTIIYTHELYANVLIVIRHVPESTIRRLDLLRRCSCKSHIIISALLDHDFIVKLFCSKVIVGTHNQASDTHTHTPD